MRHQTVLSEGKKYEFTAAGGGGLGAVLGGEGKGEGERNEGEDWVPAVLPELLVYYMYIPLASN